MKPLTALVDVDNFYVSCERLFHPGLAGKPVIVLSNNDGCVVARSQEVKDMGVKMGTPFHQVEPLAARRRIAVFSSNYELYGDISARMMNILAGFSAATEVYSIDEAFIELDSATVETVCGEIVGRCRDWLGMPVKIGVSRTKTLAKLAAEMVKRERLVTRCKILRGRAAIADALGRMDLEDVWGIGRRTADKLKGGGVATPLALSALPIADLGRRFGVVVSRTAMELKGVKCFDLETRPQANKSICCSRSFGQCVTDFQDVRASISTYASEAAAKLRRQGLKAQSVCVFVSTNRFSRTPPHYANSVCLPLPLAANDTLTIVKHTVKALERIFRSGCAYKKSGVLLAGLIPEGIEQADLFIEPDVRRSALSGIMDALNARYGPRTIVVGSSGLKRQKWQMTRHRQSSKYTTRWEELLPVT